MAIPQGFAKHRGRGGGGRGVGLRQEGDVLVCMAAQNPTIYRGKGGSVPPPRFPSLGVAASPRSHLGGGQGGREGGRTTRWALGPSEPRVSPFSLLSSPWALVGGAPAHLGLVPSHTWPTQPSGQVAPPGGPPEPSRWSRYVTDSTRNFSGDQNRTSHI